MNVIDPLSVSVVVVILLLVILFVMCELGPPAILHRAMHSPFAYAISFDILDKRPGIVFLSMSEFFRKATAEDPRRPLHSITNGTMFSPPCGPSVP